MDQPIYGLVSGNDRAREDDQYDRQPGDVFDATQAIVETRCRFAAREREGDLLAQWAANRIGV